MAKTSYRIGGGKLEAGNEEEQTIRERLGAFVGRLESEAQRRVEKRLPVEQRWLKDLRQYHGMYEPEVEAKLKKKQGSEAFINLTAAKTDALEARLWDLLFPTDDSNWGIDPTPVPDLTEGAESAVAQMFERRQQADAAKTEAEQMMAAGNPAGALAAEARMREAETAEAEAADEAEQLSKQLEEARRRADLMQAEISDQLVASRYPAEARDAISDACKMGSGVLKGPVLSGRHKSRWIKSSPESDNGAVQYVLERVEDPMPAVQRVDPWSFFPDPDQRRPADSEGFYERHLMNKSQLRKLARDPDMDQNALRELLRDDSGKEAMPAYLAQLQNVTAQSHQNMADMYHVWIYSGPVDGDDMEVLREAFDEDVDDDGELDPLLEHHVTVWFCRGRVLYFAPHPLDSDDPLYSVFNIRADETSPWGFGVPYIMRHPQAIVNGAARMMMDNAGLAAGPQIVINKQLISPADGKWELAPMKLWLQTSTAVNPNVKPFETFNIPMNQVELGAIIAMAEKIIDDVTAQPAIAQGEQGAGITKTAQGMALLMNSANVVFRRIVRNFDDDVTTPLIRRFYDWNMQFSPKEEIKGDYDVKARGSSVLLVREMQAQNLLLIAQLFGDHPTYGAMIKHLPLLQQIFRAHMIPADSITRTEQEYKQHMAELSEQVDPAAQAAMMQAETAQKALEIQQAELDAKIALAEMEWGTKMEIARMEYDRDMESAATKVSADVDKAQGQMADKAAERAAKERALAVEVAMKQRTGESAGGSV